MLSIPTKIQKCPTREIKEMTPHKHSFLAGWPVIIITPQYHTAILKENNYIDQSLQPQHPLTTLLVGL
jgi:hypothetical protein